MKFVQKYAMLTLSLDVILLYHNAAKSTISKQRKYEFGQLEKRSGM